MDVHHGATRRVPLNLQNIGSEAIWKGLIISLFLEVDRALRPMGQVRPGRFVDEFSTF